MRYRASHQRVADDRLNAAIGSVGSICPQCSTNRKVSFQERWLGKRAFPPANQRVSFEPHIAQGNRDEPFSPGTEPNWRALVETRRCQDHLTYAAGPRITHQIAAAMSSDSAEKELAKNYHGWQMT